MFTSQPTASATAVVIQLQSFRAVVVVVFAYTVGITFSYRPIRYRPDPQPWAALATKSSLFFFLFEGRNKAGNFRFFFTITQ